MSRLPWIKLFTEEWLDGTLRDNTATERGIWADLLALAGRSRRRGVIERNEGIPYSIDSIAGRFRMPVKELEKALEKFEIEGRVKREDGIIEIVNWGKYQSEYRGQKKSIVGEKEEEIISEKVKHTNSNYREEGIKADKWYQEFLKDNPLFKADEARHWREIKDWLEKKKGRQLNKALLNTWAGKLKAFSNNGAGQPKFVPGLLEKIK